MDYNEHNIEEGKEIYEAHKTMYERDVIDIVEIKKVKKEEEELEKKRLEEEEKSLNTILEGANSDKNGNFNGDNSKSKSNSDLEKGLIDNKKDK